MPPGRYSGDAAPPAPEGLDTGLLRRTREAISWANRCPNGVIAEDQSAA